MLVDKIRESINRRLNKGWYNLKNVMLNVVAFNVFTPSKNRGDAILLVYKTLAR